MADLAVSQFESGDLGTGTRLNCVAEQDASLVLSVTGSQSGRTGSWTADGTSIIQTCANGTIETMVVPQNLLEPGSHHALTPHSTFRSWEPIYSSAIYPYYSLADPSTTLVLSAARNLPIQLRNALDYNHGIYATYSWQDPNTEAFITPHSLLFLPDGSRFIAGGTAKFAVYDVQRPSAAALQVRATSASRKANRRYGRDPMRNITDPASIIAGMDLSCDHVLALGTTTGHVALYADHGLGDVVTSFRIMDHNGNRSQNNGPVNSQNGVTQVKWSPCGRYLFVAERMSDSIDFYDIRGHMTRLGHMSGRKAIANFRMEFDLFPTMSGLEVWAGGVDGCVRCWRDPEKHEGEVKPVQDWRVHVDPVCSTLLHSSGAVLATLSTRDRYAQGSGSEDRLSTTTSDSGSSSSYSDGSSSPGRSASSRSPTGSKSRDENTNSLISSPNESADSPSSSDTEDDDGDNVDDDESSQASHAGNRQHNAESPLKIWSVT